MGCGVWTLLVGAVTYWLATDAFCLLAMRWLRSSAITPRAVFWLTRGVGPMAISWIMYHLFLLLPHRPLWFYAATVVGLTGLAAAVNRDQLPTLRRVYAEIFLAIGRERWVGAYRLACLGVISLIVAFIFLIGVGFPIVSNDALAFATEAKLILRDGGLDHYPALTADPATGYFSRTFQVPCLQMLYVWFFSAAGADNDWLLRSVSPMYSVHLLALLGWLLYRRTQHVAASVFGCLALAVTPMFVSQAYLNSQDLHRIYLMLAALAWTAELLRGFDWRLATMTGVFLGLATYAHLAGAVVVPTCVAAWMALSPQTWRLRTLVAAWLLFVSIVPSATYHYVRPNVLPLLAPQFSHAESSEAEPYASAVRALAAVRGHTDPMARLLFGKLQVFTRPDYFGVLYSLGVAGVIAWMVRRDRQTLDWVLLAAAVVYSAVVVLELRKLSWSNYRYWGTTIPLAAYFAGLLICRVGPLFGKRFSPPLRGGLAAAGLAAMLVPLLLVTVLRGAKVDGAVNRDHLRGFYQFAWVKPALTHPLHAAGSLLQEMPGICVTLSHVTCADCQKRAQAHEVFSAIDYVNANLPPDATVLVHRVTRYFYYARRKGIAFDDPKLYDHRLPKDVADGVEYLQSLGVDYLLVDRDYRLYLSAPLCAIADRILAEQPGAAEFDERGARLLSLRRVDTAALRGAPASFRR